ncbi:MAG: YciI family protein [Gemmatimonas sp.]|nr:YciI family protein [Gemmatimonadaceae bacterium]
MRFMMLLKADKNTEAGLMPDEAILLAMGKYNEQLIKAGVLLAGEGLQPSSKGARVRFSGGKTTVIDGPFSETKELIAGFWMIQVKSKEEAIEWAKRVPFDPHGPSATTGGVGEIEIRQLFDVEDFSPELYPSDAAREVLESEARFRKRTNT